jgi:hypothetical protein
LLDGRIWRLGAISGKGQGKDNQQGKKAAHLALLWLG